MWGHFSEMKATVKIFKCGLHWPTLFEDAHEYFKHYRHYQQLGKLSRKDMVSLTPIIVVDIFEVWQIDCVRLFSKSFKNEYILLCVDYLSK